MLFIGGSGSDLGREFAGGQQESPALLEQGAFGTPGQEWRADEEQRKAEGRFIVSKNSPYTSSIRISWELIEMQILVPHPDQLTRKSESVF